MAEISEVVSPESAPASRRGEEPVAKRRGPKMPKWESEARSRLKAALKQHLKHLSELADQGVNEADTRLFVTDILCEGLGYHKYDDLTTEYRVGGAYADYGIRLEGDLVAFVEVKRIGTKLATKHLRQVQSYAVNEGVEWIVLTDGAKWQVYHLSGGLPISMDLAMETDILGDDSLAHKAAEMFFLSREAMKKGRLTDLWQAKRATSPTSLAQVVLSEPVVKAIRKELRRRTGYAVSVEEIASLLKDTCVRESCFGKPQQ